MIEETLTPTEVQASSDNENPPENMTVTYSMSPGFSTLLGKLNVSLAFSSYQSGKFYLLGRNANGGLMVNERLFAKAMGICVENGSIILATLFQIQRLENVLAKGQYINHTFDACFVPRVTYTTGILDTHDVGVLENGKVVFVNTRFNCLATLSKKSSFTPIWTPPFISQIVDEDRCHLNGLAMDAGKVRYVSAVSRSNTIDGWRDRRANGGVVIDVLTNEIVCEHLSMPHSPRIHNERLWILNSGTGQLGWIDLATKTFHPLAFCPGFLRGLAIQGNFAFVGLSKPRYQRFEGLTLDAKLIEADSEPWCGVQVIDLATGVCVEWFRIDGAVNEIYDLGLIPDVVCPMSLDFVTAEIRTLITHDEVNAPIFEH